MGLFVPTRRRGHELLDDHDIDTATRLRSMGDVSRSNWLFGGRRAALTEVAAAVEGRRNSLVLDVGTGFGDIPAAVRALGGQRGAPVRTIGLDGSVDLLFTARSRLDLAVCGSVTALPFRDRSVDIVLCSQLLHHFADADLGGVIAELDRVARHRVIIADIRRSWIAAAGFWFASWLLRFHPVTRHDGVVSVFRGFTTAELRRTVRGATGAAPVVRRRAGFRLTASWRPASVE